MRRGRLESLAEKNGFILGEVLRDSDALNFGPKVSGALRGLADLLDEAAAMVDPAPPRDGADPPPAKHNLSPPRPARACQTFSRSSSNAPASLPRCARAVIRKMKREPKTLRSYSHRHEILCGKTPVPPSSTFSPTSHSLPPPTSWMTHGAWSH